jgi:hypothetical protein
VETHTIPLITKRMALVSGPGRGGVRAGVEPSHEANLVEKHVKYIRSLDTVRQPAPVPWRLVDGVARGEMNWSTGSPSIYD